MAGPRACHATHAYLVPRGLGVPELAHKLEYTAARAEFGDSPQIIHSNSRLNTCLCIPLKKACLHAFLLIKPTCCFGTIHSILQFIKLSVFAMHPWSLGMHLVNRENAL